MKSISFNNVAMLPRLLDRSKTQAVMVGWKYSNWVKVPTSMTGKFARFKVGDRVKLFWKKGSRYSVFCKKCGLPKGHCLAMNCRDAINIFNMFQKLLGVVEIVEVEKIFKDDKPYWKYVWKWLEK